MDRPRTVGTPAYWARHSALLGGMLGWLMPVALMTGVAGEPGALWMLFSPWGLGTLVAGVLSGAVVGVVHPWLLDRLRGRVPVLVVAAAQACTGAVVGAGAGLGWAVANAWMYSPAAALDDLGFPVATGAVLGAVVAPLWWLPFTVATVTGRSWPVTLTVGLGAPASILLLVRLLLAALEAWGHP